MAAKNGIIILIMDFRDKITIITDKNGKQQGVVDMDLLETIVGYANDIDLLELMAEAEKEESLSLEEAIEYYSKLPKQAWK